MIRGGRKPNVWSVRRAAVVVSIVVSVCGDEHVSEKHAGSRRISTRMRKSAPDEKFCFGRRPTLVDHRLCGLAITFVNSPVVFLLSCADVGAAGVRPSCRLRLGIPSPTSS